MGNPFVNLRQEALILFADVIDSSKYSSVLGLETYCSSILKFQTLFSALATTYFTDDATENDYSSVRIHGDEGAVFAIFHSIPKDELVTKGIQFAFELKARMEIEFYETNPSEIVPQKMEVGIGIHVGDVALIVEDAERKLHLSGVAKDCKISRVEGYSINYAKRVESASRAGKYSKIILSDEAASVIRKRPIILEPVHSALKGISNSEKLYEVRSAFFRNVPLRKDVIDYEKFVEFYISDFSNLNFVRKPWLKSFVASVIDSKSVSKQLKHQEKEYWDLLVKFARRDPNEDDPILLFIRALDLGNKGENSKRLKILKEIVDRFPTFNSAKKEYVKTYWLTVKDKKDKSEAQKVSDMITDYLHYYPYLMRDNEVEEINRIAEEVKLVLEN